MISPPQIETCYLYDADIPEWKNDIVRNADGCDLGTLVIDKHYAFVVKTDKFAECRVSPIKDNPNLFSTGYEESQLSMARMNILRTTPDGRLHFLPIPAGVEGEWDAEGIEAFNNDDVAGYVRCTSDFSDDPVTTGDYSFEFDLSDGVGDIYAPVINTFSPINGPGDASRYTIGINVNEVEFRLKVTDLGSGVKDCKYSSENIAFGQMQDMNCRQPTAEEAGGDITTQNNLLICETPTPLTEFNLATNDFYFNCQDNDGNRNPTNIKYEIIKANSLSITILSPNINTIPLIKNTNTLMKIRTSDGLNNGAALCSFNYNKIGGGPSGVNQLFESDTSPKNGIKEHNHTLDFFPESGDYKIDITCHSFSDEEDTATKSFNIKFEKPSVLADANGNECNLELAWTDLATGNRISGNVQEDQTVGVVFKANNFINLPKFSEKEYHVRLYEIDQKTILGIDRSEKEDVTTTSNFPSSIIFGNDILYETTWTVKWFQDTGNDGPDPTYQFEIVDSNKKSNTIKVIKSTGTQDSQIKPGGVCTTNQNCNGVYNNDPVPVCINTQQGCPITQPSLDPSLCGNNILNPGESCDGNLLNSKTCNNLGFNSGSLKCKTDCSGFDSSQCSNKGPTLPGEECEINNCAGILNLNLVCNDLGGDNCPAGTGGTNPIDNTGESSLRISNLAPSGTVQDTRVTLIVDLKDGPNQFGKDAECRYTNTYSNSLVSGTDSTLFSGVLTEGGDIPGGATRYSKQVDVSVGDNEFYLKCRDSQGKYTKLQTIKFKVQIPTTQALSIIRTFPTGLYGKKTIKLETEIQGGADKGESVKCIFTGAGANSITPATEAVKQKITDNRYKHSLDVTAAANGNYKVSINCEDRSQQTISGEINFNLQEDNLAPEIQQIVAKANVKYITLNEPGVCEISVGDTQPNANTQWSETSRDTTNQAKQIITANNNYYLRCKDLWDNQMGIVRINL